jgi:prepilin-type N-terminal cleavage/methylation domain-containing protein
MRVHPGFTLIELVTVLAVLSIFAAVSVPSAARARATVNGAAGARRLALVLRSVQAEAQGGGHPVRVQVAGDGDYVVTDQTSGVVTKGSLGVRVSSTYPDGALEFSARGWAGLPGASSPRAGHFDVAGRTGSRSVIVQLAGCVRCP